MCIAGKFALLMPHKVCNPPPWEIAVQGPFPRKLAGKSWQVTKGSFPLSNRSQSSAAKLSLGQRVESAAMHYSRCSGSRLMTGPEALHVKELAHQQVVHKSNIKKNNRSIQFIYGLLGNSAIADDSLVNATALAQFKDLALRE